MTTKFIDDNGIASYDSISCEQDLNLKPMISINPPPKDGRCDCCGKHIGELETFRKEGDPHVGIFDEALLIKTFRPMGPYDEEAENAMNKATEYFNSIDEKNKDPLEWMIKKFGDLKGRHLYCAYQAYHQIGSSWECRNCVVLDTNEYYKLLETNLQDGS